MMVEDEKFFAWLDGELGEADAAEMEAKVAADPRLTRAADEHRRMQARLTSAFDSVLDAPVPERIAAAARARPPADVLDFAAKRTARNKRPWGSPPQWAAMAATLAIGVLVGTNLPNRADNASVQIQGGGMVAAGDLARALETQLASAPTAGEAKIGVTFRDASGAVCRSFTAQAASGLACRERDGWQVRGLFAAPDGQSTDYRMAAGMDPNLAGLIDSSMAGEPFDAAAEKAAREKGWR
jgi:hypothetical protein